MADDPETPAHPATSWLVGEMLAERFGAVTPPAPGPDYARRRWLMKDQVEERRRVLCQALDDPAAHPAADGRVAPVIPLNPARRHAS